MVMVMVMVMMVAMVMMVMVLVIMVVMVPEEARALHPFPDLPHPPTVGHASTFGIIKIISISNNIIIPIIKIIIITIIILIIKIIILIIPGKKVRKHFKGELYRGKLLLEAGKSLFHYVLPAFLSFLLLFIYYYD